MNFRQTINELINLGSKKRKTKCPLILEISIDPTIPYRGHTIGHTIYDKCIPPRFTDSTVTDTFFQNSLEQIEWRFGVEIEKIEV